MILLESFKAIVAHFDLQLHKMDMKTTFCNGDLFDDVYMVLTGGFQTACNENIMCKLKKFIYGLMQALRQWYLKFDKSHHLEWLNRESC